MNDNKEIQLARVTKIFTAEMAHRLMNYAGACKNIHGHSYRIYVTFEGLVHAHTGMVKDFKSIKETVGRYIDETFDHKLVLELGDPLVDVLQDAAIFNPKNSTDMTLLDCPPTAENMAVMIGERWAEGGCVEVCVWETATSVATWRAE